MPKMPEAEVSLRLAFWLLDHQIVNGPIEIAIDGAQVRVKDVVHFDLPGFMATIGWRSLGQVDVWQSEWAHTLPSHRIRIHSNPGRGDVVARLRSGRTFRAECKKGPLIRTASSPEYPLLREALGQLLTVEEVTDGDIFAVAVPHSPKFEALAARWRRAPLIKRFGIQILTVDQKGNVLGFDLDAAGLQAVDSPVGAK
jgi:hypothetical protein